MTKRNSLCEGGFVSFLGRLFWLEARPCHRPYGLDCRNWVMELLYSFGMKEGPIAAFYVSDSWDVHPCLNAQDWELKEISPFFVTLVNFLTGGKT